MLNKKEKTATVVVTFNRKNLLKECLDSLLNLSEKPDSIIIVDNNSSDGTEEMLKENYLENKIFDYLRLRENSGGAGGFYYGMKRAYEKNFDWLWLMDDDVVAEKNALETYSKYKEFSKFIQGRRVLKNGNIFEWGQMFNPKNS